MDQVIIIAEAGVNHNGSMTLAKKLIDAAADAGADYVKFQTFKAERLVSKRAPKAEYQKNNSQDNNESQFDMLRKLELTEADHHELKRYATERSIKFFSTAFDEEGLDFLESLSMDMFKIPSGEITNLPYLRKIAGKKKPTILSTGMSDLSEVEAAVTVLCENGLSRQDITILHCNTEYPTPFEDVNIKAMLSIRDALKTKVGYSDHTMGIEVPIAAVALGAVCIEKHFTLDRSMEGPDHKASLEPNELKSMVTAIRHIEQALRGSGVKSPTPSEKKNIAIARKSIHLRRDLPKDHLLSEADLIMKRPGTGISPMDLPKIIGKRLTDHLEADTLLLYNHLY
jgi:N,N'-diacetyllegionaminate synthase